MDTARLVGVLAALPVPAALFRADGTAAAINASGEELFVFDPIAPLSTQHWRVMLHPFGEVAREAMAFVQATNTVVVRPITLPADGAVFTLRVAPFDDALVLVTVADVSEEHQRRVALERAERERRTLFMLAPATVRVIDVSGRIIRTNGEADRLRGDQAPTTLRELWEREAPHEVSDDGQPARALSFLDTPGMRALAGVSVRQQRLQCRRADGMRLVEANAAPMTDADGSVVGVMLVDHDITDRQRRDRSPSPSSSSAVDAAQFDRLVEERSREVIASNEERVRERRLAAVGQLAAGVMHDVNNALNPIMASAYLLQHHAESPAAVRDYAERIRAAAEIGAATASRVGRFIRQEPLHAGGDEEIDLAQLVVEVLDLTEPMRLRRSVDSREVRIVKELEAGVNGRGLPGEIREALLNLVQNAMDAMPEGGTLTVRCWGDGAEACLSVQDTGVGMSEEVQERAFEPFFTTKGSKGSGLGLAEVYGIARRHRGQVSISSAPGKGSTVSLRLPRAGGAPAPAPAAVVAPATPQRILVVEDHDDGRVLLRRILEGDRHVVDAVATIAEARARLAVEGPMPYDLMLTDVGLPDGSGWDLAREGRASWPTLRVGVITGWEATTGSDEARGVEFVLRKPLRAQELKAHIAGRMPPSTNE
ncbi:MAG TPA: ATP-binding protein [Gemmatimonas sp.]|uniref:ATP-binding protein n=1 Tax=Gemmatimonas sp. TaxID=1962908 RepID=UPI002EDB4B59